MGGCLLFVIFILLIPASAAWSGWVMLQNYNWFVAPIQGAPKLTIGNMLGISLIMNMILAGHVKMSSDEKEKSLTETVLAGLTRMVFIPALFLFFG